MQSEVLKLSSDVLQFMSGIETLETPDALLDGLHKATHSVPFLNVLGAARFPLRWGDWSGFEKNKTVFLHESVATGWFEEHAELTKRHPGPSITFAQLSMAPFTLTDIMRMMEPLGIDRWPIELALRYGIRDSFNCPVAGRWVVIFWSPNVLALSEETRAVLLMGATFTAIRLQKLIPPHAGGVGKGHVLTARELSVLRLLSTGHSMRDTASLLELGEETIRSHLKKAQTKLGVHDRSHAIAQALRLHLIP
jgi:DNA-binding CsgD family transcriptional regulator